MEGGRESAHCRQCSHNARWKKTTSSKELTISSEELTISNKELTISREELTVSSEELTISSGENRRAQHTYINKYAEQQRRSEEQLWRHLPFQSAIPLPQPQSECTCP